MWELTLIGEKQDYFHFVLFEDTLRKLFSNQVLVAISDKNNLLCCSIAVNNRKNLNIIKKIILELIIKICKEEYYKENLKFKNVNDEFNYYILLMAVLTNLKEEVEYAKVKIKFSKIIHIRSLVKFRLVKLNKLWEDNLNYYNYVFNCNSQEKIYLDFLKFLSKNHNSDTEIVYLVQNNDNLLILDKNKHIIISTSQKDEIGLIVNLILYSPKKLIVNCYNNLSKNIVNLLEYIFNDRMCIVL